MAMTRLVNSSGEPCFSITGAAQALGVSRQAVSEMVKSGRLAGVERYQLRGSHGVAVIPKRAVAACRLDMKLRLASRVLKGSARAKLAMWHRYEDRLCPRILTCSACGAVKPANAHPIGWVKRFRVDLRRVEARCPKCAATKHLPKGGS